jgi:hypothetical protein
MMMMMTLLLHVQPMALFLWLDGQHDHPMMTN